MGTGRGFLWLYNNVTVQIPLQNVQNKMLNERYRHALKHVPSSGDLIYNVLQLYYLNLKTILKPQNEGMFNQP
jgi:hypothetical protein